jgi:hypothetical protein
MAMKRLSPLERAAFLFHDVFGLASRRSRTPSGASRPPAASSPVAPVTTSEQPAHAFRWPASEVWRSRKRSLRPLVAAICRLFGPCSHRMLSSTPTAAARGRPRSHQSSALRRSLGCTRISRACSLSTASRLVRWGLAQRTAGLRHPRGRGDAPDDGATDRGRPDHRDLCRKESRQTATYQCGDAAPIGEPRRRSARENLR